MNANCNSVVIHFKKGCPDVTDPPPLVIPSSEKIDMEHLLRDLQKYKNWLSAPAWQAWEQFIANSATLNQLGAAPIQWKFPLLVSAALVASQSRIHDQTDPMSVETTALVAKETATPAKVEYFNANNSYFDN